MFATHSFAQSNHQLADKTAFQISAPWSPAYDVRSDVAIVYGYDSTFNDRVEQYKQHGYNVQFMTGIAWGNYQDYFSGQWDGKSHLDEGQMDRKGDSIGHGRNVPYTVPTDSYIAYFKTLIKKVIDAGINTIYLEEPEFWARAGYSEAFKREWQSYYGFPWMPQHESPEATYLSSKLKYHLYFKALKEVFLYAKEYGQSQGKNIRCFVPTHSLLNYSSWQIVSPEASLAALPGMDGYIAQVWTGTSREPLIYNGVKKERVFENAFLEYGSMLSMTAPIGRTMYFLTDPIEDWPRTWDDYKRNYEATFTAEILYPTVSHFEVMPWPNRIYLGKFKLENSNERQPISPAYATQMQVMINALNFMPASSNTINGSKGIGVLAGNSMMFQRFPTHEGYEDPQLSNFYGMVLPLEKRGIPADIVHMENLGFPAALQNTKVLVMSYTNMKPQSPQVHQQLAAWVKKGGTLLYYGRDNDPFQKVQEWWNTNGLNYAAPSEHLFEQMNINPNDHASVYHYGKGTVYVVRKDPKELVLTPGADSAFFNLIKDAYEASNHTKLITKNYFYLERGPYDIASVMDESVSDKHLTINGPVIDLFDPFLPVLNQKIVQPGQQAFLYDLKRIKDKKTPQVLCAASRVYDEKRDAHSYTFIAKSPDNTNNVMRILLPAKPQNVTVKDANGNVMNDAFYSWDELSNTCLLQCRNASPGIAVSITW
ncbi:hypothetical protein FC093_11990 [Ilyomonas limi]|uniref:Beta-galactosidase trimerisation domain-containing protein n=1 Tax=Ilyomonas limi TaxID=2575867 RepID=A0A4U3L082_9BACT|nr:hypothetical protein FC093_11990 [Ilyomonas limi]